MISRDGAHELQPSDLIVFVIYTASSLSGDGLVPRPSSCDEVPVGQGHVTVPVQSRRRVRKGANNKRAHSDHQRSPIGRIVHFFLVCAHFQLTRWLIIPPPPPPPPPEILISRDGAHELQPSDLIIFVIYTASSLSGDGLVPRPSSCDKVPITPCWLNITPLRLHELEEIH